MLLSMPASDKAFLIHLATEDGGHEGADCGDKEEGLVVRLSLLLCSGQIVPQRKHRANLRVWEAFKRERLE